MSDTIHRMEFDGRGVARSLCGRLTDEHEPLPAGHPIAGYKARVTCGQCKKHLRKLRDAIDYQLGDE